ncbi:MAG: IS1595 family transposase [Xanthobacteraceae bacterium]
MSNAFAADHFRNDTAARETFERILWPNGPVCPHCASTKAYPTKKPGLFRCAEAECRKDFTITVGTVMERSKVPLHKWMMAFYLMCSSKKGVSAHQLHRALGLTYQTAWFVAHRVREAMRDGGLGQLGGEGGIVEADETYFGRVEKANVKTRSTSGRPYTKSGKTANKRPIVGLVERGGKVRTFHTAVVDKATVMQIVRENVSRESRLHTDESRLYHGAEAHFTSHETVRHTAKEYVRGDVHTNSAEGYFSIFKRGMRGIYQHCSEKHLHRYLAEFDFRYNHRVRLGMGDIDRTYAAIRGANGKRIYYKQPH